MPSTLAVLQCLCLGSVARDSGFFGFWTFDDCRILPIGMYCITDNTIPSSGPFFDLRFQMVRCAFFKNVALPMYYSWMARKKQLDDGNEALAGCLADDWRTAAEEWIRRRAEMPA